MDNLFFKRLRILYDELSDTRIMTLTRQDYADYLGVTRNQVSAWLDKKAEPSLDNLILIAKKHNVAVDWLIGLSDIRNPKLDLDSELSILVQERSPNFKKAFIHLLKNI